MQITNNDDHSEHDDDRGCQRTKTYADQQAERANKNAIYLLRELTTTKLPLYLSDTVRPQKNKWKSSGYGIVEVNMPSYEGWHIGQR